MISFIEFDSLSWSKIEDKTWLPKVFSDAKDSRLLNLSLILLMVDSKNFDDGINLNNEIKYSFKVLISVFVSPKPISLSSQFIAKIELFETILSLFNKLVINLFTNFFIELSLLCFKNLSNNSSKLLKL